MGMGCYLHYYRSIWAKFVKSTVLFDYTVGLSQIIDLQANV